MLTESEQREKRLRDLTRIIRGTPRGRRAVIPENLDPLEAGAGWQPARLGPLEYKLPTEAPKRPQGNARVLVGPVQDGSWRPLSITPETVEQHLEVLFEPPAA
jgi:hypothetical protein